MSSYEETRSASRSFRIELDTHDERSKKRRTRTRTRMREDNSDTTHTYSIVLTSRADCGLSLTRLSVLPIELTIYLVSDSIYAIRSRSLL